MATSDACVAVADPGICERGGGFQPYGHRNKTPGRNFSATRRTNINRQGRHYYQKGGTLVTGAANSQRKGGGPPPPPPPGSATVVWESLVITNTVSGEAVKLERQYRPRGKSQ